MDDRTKEVKKSSKKLIMQILIIIAGILGTTYATTYVLNAINVNIVSAGINVVYSGPSSISSVNLTPINDSTVTSNTENVIKIEFTVKGASTNPDIPIIYDVALEDLEIQKALRNKYMKWQLYKNNTLISSGDFSPQFDNIVDGRLVLTEIQQDLPKFAYVPDSYKFLIWISESCPSKIDCTEDMDQSAMLNKKIAGKIAIETYTKGKKALVRRPTEDKKANSPKLIEGMVPIYYDDTVREWKKADKDNANNSWYDYDAGNWANVALVGDVSSYSNSIAKRTTYANAAVGTTVSETDILAYYVWIPRFKYRVWNITKTIGVDTYDAEDTGIDITWEEGTASTGTVTCSVNGITKLETCSLATGASSSYYTHPAFKLGTTNLTGFWFGKFETTGTSTIPTVKPNIASQKSLSESTFFSINKKFGSESYYFDEKNKILVDAHMARSMEWAAVAYLSHSLYGRCVTSCTDMPLGTSISTGMGNYKSNVTYTTTNNITGIYDIGSGASEYVIGAMYNSDASAIAYGNSGFSSVTLPYNSRYVDLYAYGTTTSDQTAVKRAKLGDGISEVVTTSSVISESATTWFGGNLAFVYATEGTSSSVSPWLIRGFTESSTISGIKAGVFSAHYSGGGTGNSFTSPASRSVITSN